MLLDKKTLKVIPKPRSP